MCYVRIGTNLFGVLFKISNNHPILFVWESPTPLPGQELVVDKINWQLLKIVRAFPHSKAIAFTEQNAYFSTNNSCCDPSVVKSSLETEKN